MDRDLALTAVLAVLAVLALGVTAATLDTAVETDGGGGPVGGGATGPPSEDGDGGGGDSAAADGGGGPLFEPVCVPALARPPAVLAILAVAALLGYVVYRRTGSVLPPIAFGVAFGIPVVLLWALVTACGPMPTLGPPSMLGGGGNATGVGAGGGPGGGGGSVSTPEALFTVVLVVTLLASVALLVVSTGEDDRADDPPGETDDEPVDVAAIGRAAGEAADRIEADADVDNEVYRAWAEMTASLDVARPRSSTPAEFAASAVDAGMARDDVDELTRLFEAVRYGGAEPTPERECRAVAALRRIESTYADGDGDPPGGDGDRVGTDGDRPGSDDGGPRGDGAGGSGGRP